jgi:hypothetical protein
MKHATIPLQTEYAERSVNIKYEPTCAPAKNGGEKDWTKSTSHKVWNRVFLDCLRPPTLAGHL